MKFFIIIATLVACCYAAPTPDLQYPSPINPSVVIESKPQDKVVLITDPTELAKFKRETNQPLYPTVLPEEHPHHIAKRDHKPEHETKPANKPQTPEPPKKSHQHPPATPNNAAQKTHPEPPKIPSSNKHNRRDVEAHQKPGHETKPAKKPQAPQPPKKSHSTTTTKKPTQKSHPEPLTKPLPSKRNRRDVETYQKPQTLPAHSHHVHTTPEGFQKPQTLPIILTEKSETAEQHKRDIPVPLVPKHQHPEESPKDSSSKEDSDKDSKVVKKEENIENHASKDEVQVEDLSESKPFHQSLNLNHHLPTDAISTADKNKPNISDDHLSADEVTTTSEHPLLRPNPVSVAELFARAKTN